MRLVNHRRPANESRIAEYEAGHSSHSRAAEAAHLRTRPISEPRVKRADTSRSRARRDGNANICLMAKFKMCLKYDFEGVVGLGLIASAVGMSAQRPPASAPPPQSPPAPSVVRRMGVSCPVGNGRPPIPRRSPGAGLIEVLCSLHHEYRPEKQGCLTPNHSGGQVLFLVVHCLKTRPVTWG